MIREDGSPVSHENFPIMETLRTGEPRSNQVLGLYRPDDTIVWLNVNTRPLSNHDNTLYAVVGSFSDITHRKQTEQELQKSEHRFIF